MLRAPSTLEIQGFMSIYVICCHDNRLSTSPGCSPFRHVTVMADVTGTVLLLLPETGRHFVNFFTFGVVNFILFLVLV